MNYKKHLQTNLIRLSNLKILIYKLKIYYLDLDPVFQRITYSEAVVQLISLFFEKPQCVQSMYIFKQPHIGGEVGAHQDGTFLITQPQSCIGLWWALENTTIHNGCLWAIPGIL